MPMACADTFIDCIRVCLVFPNRLSRLIRHPVPTMRADRRFAQQGAFAAMHASVQNAVDWHDYSAWQRSTDIMRSLVSMHPSRLITRHRQMGVLLEFDDNSEEHVHAGVSLFVGSGMQRCEATGISSAEEDGRWIQFAKQRQCLGFATFYSCERRALRDAPRCQRCFQCGAVPRSDGGAYSAPRCLIQPAHPAAWTTVGLGDLVLDFSRSHRTTSIIRGCRAFNHSRLSYSQPTTALIWKRMECRVAMSGHDTICVVQI